MKYCHILIIATLAFSCSGRKSAIEPAEASIQIEETGSIEEWPKEHTMSYDCFFPIETDSVVIVPLRESKEHMLGQITQVTLHKDTLVIIDSRHVYLFDAGGRYITTIGAIGHGPNEYVDFGGCYVAADSIYIKDRGTGGILTYDFDGLLTNKRSFPDGIPQNFCVLENGVLLGAFSGYRPNSTYRLTMYNSQNEVVGTALPYTEPQEYVAGTFINISEKNALFVYPLCDIIYKVSDDNLEPALRMNIYNENIVADFISTTSSMTQDKFIKALYTTEGLVNHVEVYPHRKNSWIVYYQDSNGSYYSFIDDKSRRDYVRGDINKKKLYYPFTIISSSEQWVYAYIDIASFSFMDDTTQNWWQNYIIEHSIYPLSINNIKSGQPLLLKMHIRE